MKLSDITRHEVIAAIRECDELGEAAFLANYGYQAARQWQLRYKGRSYPSKAILGVAGSLNADQFFGGVAQTVPALQRLGFQVRNGARVRVDQAVVELAERHKLPTAELGCDPAAYFHSGSNRPDEIRGLAAVGADVGVVATELLTSRASVDALLALDDSDVNVFVDSGAFSEVRETGPGQFEVVDEITAERWTAVLDLYRELAWTLGTQLFVVAPDRVGDQAKTLELLRTYGDDLFDLWRFGARILLPCQKGRLSQAEFYYAARVAVLGGRVSPEFELIPALPCKKAATTSAEAAEFCRSTRPHHVHFLGLGPKNAKVDDYLDALGGGCSYSLDSNWIRANVGHTNGPGNGPRAYTQARAIATTVCATVGLGVSELAMILAHGGGVIR